MAARDSQPQPHPPPQLQATTRPRHLIGSPLNSARISSMGHTMVPQQIRAQRRPDPPKSHQNHPRSSQASQNTRRHFGLAQTLPPMGLSITGSLLPRRMTPNVARRVARPRSGYYRLGNSARSAGLSAPKIGRQVDYSR